MNKLHISLILFFAFNLSTTLVFGDYLPDDSAKAKYDTTKKDSDDAKTRDFEFGAEYGSDQGIHGIHSNIKLPYFTPEFTYHAKSGFYTEINEEYLLLPSNKGGGFDAFNVNPGWDINLTENSILNFSISHYTFNPGEAPALKELRSDLSNVFETYFEQWVGETRFKMSIDYDIYSKDTNVSTKNDWVFSPDIQHTFEIDPNENSSISIIPEAYIDFGTRNAYTRLKAIQEEDSAISNNVNLTERQKARREKAVLKKNSNINASFGSLDYALMLSVEYKIGRWEITPAYTYNPSLYQPPGQKYPPLSIFTVDLTYTISSKK